MGMLVPSSSGNSVLAALAFTSAAQIALDAAAPDIQRPCLTDARTRPQGKLAHAGRPTLQGLAALKDPRGGTEHICVADLQVMARQVCFIFWHLPRRAGWGVQPKVHMGGRRFIGYLGPGGALRACIALDRLHSCALYTILTTAL